MTEAEAHPGVSLVIAYAPCALQGPDGGMSKSQTVRGAPLVPLCVRVRERLCAGA